VPLSRFSRDHPTLVNPDRLIANDGAPELVHRRQINVSPFNFVTLRSQAARDRFGKTAKNPAVPARTAGANFGHFFFDLFFAFFAARARFNTFPKTLLSAVLILISPTTDSISVEMSTGIFH
jgi:hypothetical protein